MEIKAWIGMVAIFFILAIAVSVVVLQDAEAREFRGEKSITPIYHDPIRDYYDTRQQLSTYPPEPVFYNSFTIRPISQFVECGWMEITGRVPYSGLVTVEVSTETLADENPDRPYMKTITTQNINSNPAQELRGYVQMPCNFEPTYYMVYLTWQEFPFEIEATTAYSHLGFSVGYEVLVQ